MSTVSGAQSLRTAKRLAMACSGLVMLSACARNSETEIRSRLGQWFYLGATYYFESRMRCTGAMMSVSVEYPRPELPLQVSLDRALAVLRADGIAAIRIAGVTPAEVTDALLSHGTGAFGRDALAASALSSACFEDAEISEFLHEALTRPGAILAYDNITEGLIVLDPYRNRLFYVASDVW